MQVEFTFSIGDTVKLKDLALTGTVTGLLHEQHGQQYRVAWWSNGERRCEWLHPFEIT